LGYVKVYCVRGRGEVPETVGMLGLGVMLGAMVEALEEVGVGVV
jgi:hypothetical protein